MKKLLILLLLILSSVPLSVFAQEEVEILDQTTNSSVTEQIEEGKIEIIDEQTKKSSSKHFDLKLERGAQSPFGSKYIPYTLTITSHFSSPKTQIIWNVPYTLEIKEKHSSFLNNIQKGETFILKANVKPIKEGIHDISVSVISWQPRTNYINSIKDTIHLDNHLVLQPVSNQYKWMSALMYLLIFLTFILLIVGGYLLIKKLVPIGKKWLTPPR